MKLLLPCLLAVAPALLAQSGAVSLSPQLDDWKREIETRGKGRVIIARIPTMDGALTLPADTEQRAILRRFFRLETFRAQFTRTHAVSINYDDVEGKFHFVLLNTARAGEYPDAEDAVLAHEFGHLWLNVQGLASPLYTPGPRSCQAVHVGDIVQHVLIRSELRTRGIAFLNYWVRNLEAALQQIGAQPQQSGAKPDPCRRLERFALLMDVRLGLTPESWERRADFLTRLDESDPALSPAAGDLEAFLKPLDLTQAEDYARAIDFTRAIADRFFEESAR